MKITLWTTQSILAATFLAAAGLKLFAFDKMTAGDPGAAQLHGLFVFVAICETAGAIGLVAPLLTRIYPILTAWAATGLATISLLAGFFHLSRSEYSEIPAAGVLFLLAIFVVWGRGFKRIGMDGYGSRATAHS